MSDAQAASRGHALTARWLAAAAAAQLVWRALAPGLSLAESPMAAHGPLSRVRAIVVRVEPGAAELALATATRDHGLRAAWTVDSLPPGAIAAWNAGQFVTARPWGWLVRDGHEEQPPASGPLSMALVVEKGGGVSLVPAGEIAGIRQRAWLAFQSYPALLIGRGELPWQLRARGRGADLEHRDSRLAIGLDASGRLLVVLTRFTGVGPAGEQLPWGPTAPEMAVWMRQLGCTRAMLLDGGMSSQLVVRGSDGGLRRWPNLRPVPMGMLIMSPENRPQSAAPVTVGRR